jgi:hypothetical protein
LGKPQLDKLEAVSATGSASPPGPTPPRSDGPALRPRPPLARGCQRTDTGAPRPPVPKGTRSRHPRRKAVLPKGEILSYASAVALAGPKQVPNRTRGAGSRASFRPAIMRVPGLGFEGPIIRVIEANATGSTSSCRPLRREGGCRARLRRSSRRGLIRAPLPSSDNPAPRRDHPAPPRGKKGTILRQRAVAMIKLVG